jgi:ATP-dependent exoDNAse (exonuclease V) alpha subunit
MLSDIPNLSGSFARFGNGDVLGDLLRYDSNGKFVFVGDPCQLPPVGQQFSPALEVDYLASKYQLNVQQMELTEIIRHEQDSGILSASLRLRQLYQKTKNQQIQTFASKQWSYLPLRGYNDIFVRYTTIDLVNQYVEKIKKHSLEYATLICHTNRQCSAINNTVRNMLYNNPERLIVGDLLMVTQNNYLVDLVNGDLVVVESIGDYERRANMTFRQVQVKELSAKKSYSLLLLEDTLMSLQPNITGEQHKALMVDFYYRMKEKKIHHKSELFKKMMQKDDYLNALRVSYGYALTCHKSQGGEWNEVYFYMDNKIQAMNPPGIYQWWYTAVTRAKKFLHVVNEWFVKS